ncbi:MULTISPECIES: hypothetical protein [Flavobacteriaceae]|uniref:hypothetical protein n=1 Tax=Flavobacteriaceae TaxID=49546 RepID=UPI0014917B98|nr:MULTISPECIES: hypothetical protein [Allomuricauda]MDC6367430.1 hypothetical protein [Muricauda sp. AC10]
MKKISVILLTAALMVSIGVQANEKAEINPQKKLVSQIHELLKNNSLDFGTGELTATIRFTVNKKGEMVVLSVETKEDILDGFLKSRLNYKKVELQAFKEGRVYLLPVRFTA